MELRVEGLDFVKLPLKVIRPFKVATGQTTNPVHVVCRLKISGAAGFGAAGPYKVLDQTTEVIFQALADVQKQIVGQSFPHATFLREWIHTHLESLGAASALDMAVWDWQGRHANKPVYQLLNAQNPRLTVTTDLTIGLESAETTLKLVSEHIRDGFTRLKIKMGHPLVAQKKLAKQIRDKAGAEIELTADANQAYTVDEALDLAAVLKENNFLLLEQPVSADSFATLGEVSRKSPLPIFADESARTPEAIREIGRNKLAHGVVLKIAKYGGISPTLAAITAAKEHNLEMMFGCNTETTLSIAAALHVALAHPEITHIDLDGHILLEDNPLHVITTQQNKLSPLSVGLGDDTHLKSLFK